MAKISFDFDDTLSETRVQMFAKMLIQRGHDVSITTSRMSNERAGNDNWNRDLEVVASYLGIDEIKYCNLQPKWKYFKDSDILIHLDDDVDDVDSINEMTDTKCFFYVNTIDPSLWQEILEYIKKQAG